MQTDTQEMQLAPPQPDEPPMKQLAPFSTLEDEARKMIVSAESIALLPPTAANAMVARTMRLQIKPLRVAVEKRHAELKRPILDAGNALDDGKNALLDLLKPMEAKLLAIEQHAEREALRIEDEKRTTRHVEISPFLTGPLSVDLGKMPDDEYAKVLADAKDLAQLREDRARKEAEAAAAQAKAEAEERERIRLENERLKAEAEAERIALAKEREEAARLAREAKAKADAELAAAQKEHEEQLRKDRERVTAEFKAAEAKARAEREEADRIAAAERNEIEYAAKAAADHAKKEQAKRDAAAKVAREAAEAKAQEERQAREKLEAEIADKKAADAKAEADRKEAERKAAAAPAKEKLLNFAHEVRLLALKTFSVNSSELVKEVAEKTESFAKWIEAMAEKP